jgi:hypothetical protein
LLHRYTGHPAEAPLSIGDFNFQRPAAAANKSFALFTPLFRAYTEFVVPPVQIFKYSDFTKILTRCRKSCTPETDQLHLLLYSLVANDTFRLSQKSEMAWRSTLCTSKPAYHLNLLTAVSHCLFGKLDGAKTSRERSLHFLQMASKPPLPEKYSCAAFIFVI